MSRWRRFLRAVAIAATAALLLFALTYWQRAAILNGIGRQLIREDVLAPADAIVVLSGGVPAREMEAADLFREGMAPILLIPHDPESAGRRQLRERGVMMESELELRLRILQSLGVPRAAIVVLDPEIPSTDVEAKLVVDHAVSRGLKSLIVVTTAMHTGRAGFVYERLVRKSGIRVAVRRARTDPNTPESWWRSRVGLRDGLIEFQKTLVYRIRR